MVKKSTRFAKLGRPLCFIILAMMLLPLLLSATAPQATANPGWWDSNWDYRTPITLNIGENVPPENYQYRIVLDKVDNLNSHCLDNFQDVRFLEDGASGELSFWIENYISGDNAIFWVRREENSLTDNTIYVYHWNTSAIPTENGDSTFDFFDDFPGSSLDTIKWDNTITAGASATVSGGILTLNVPTQANKTAYIASTSSFSTNYAVRARAKSSTNGIPNAWNNVAGWGIRGDSEHLIAYVTGDGTKFYVKDSGGNAQRDLSGEDWTSYRNFDITWRTDEGKIYVDGVLKYTETTYVPSSSLSVEIGPGTYSSAPATEENLWVDWVFVRKYVYPEPTASAGAEEMTEFPTVSNIACDNILLDNHVDWAASSVVTTTKIQADVEFETGKTVVKENVWFEIRDATDTLVDNKTATENLYLTENTQRFFVVFDSTDNDFNASELGGFDLKVGAKDNAGSSNTTSSSNLFYVDEATATSNVENLLGHYIRTYGTVSRASGETLTGLEIVKIIDNEMETFYGELSGNNWENIRAPSTAGQFYLKFKAENLDGLTSATSYAFPNFAPEVISTSSSEALVDKDQDYAGSGAILTTTLTARIRDNDGRDDLNAARIAVRDKNDAVQENENVWSTRSIVDENQYDVTLAYNPADNLPNDNLGAFDIWAYAADAYGVVASEWQTSEFTVDDLTSTINFDPASPYIGWNLTVSGTHSRVSGGAASIDASWLIDNKHGQLALGASNTYDNTYTISNATLEENISVTLRVRDSPLDGVTVSSYKTNENVKFQVEVRFEENYEIIQWIPDENRAVEMLFEWDGGTHPYTLTSNPENITVPASGIATNIVKITDNDAYWRYVIPEFSGGILTFVLVDDPETVEQFRFFLQDYTGLYTPPNGQLLIKSWIGTDLAGINADFWGADWRTTAWLVTGTQYQMWVRAPSAALRLVGPIDAVVPSEEKTIIVQVLISELDPIFNHVYWAAWRESGTIVRVEYHDNLDNTIEAHVGIYDMDGDLMSQYQPDNEWFIVTWPEAENTESYEIVLTVQHGEYGSFTLDMPIGLMDRLGESPGGVSELFGLPVGMTLAGVGSIILVFVVMLSFDALRVQLGVLAMALATIFCWYMGFLPLPGPYGGAFTATLILVAAVLFALTWRRGK